jgi:hypothetical protein
VLPAQSNTTERPFCNALIASGPITLRILIYSLEELLEDPIGSFADTRLRQSSVAGRDTASSLAIPVMPAPGSP